MALVIVPVKLPDRTKLAVSDALTSKGRVYLTPESVGIVWDECMVAIGRTSLPPIALEVSTSGIRLTDRVVVDGCEDLSGVVTGILERMRARYIEVSWFHNGVHHEHWFDEFRLKKVD